MTGENETFGSIKEIVSQAVSIKMTIKQKLWDYAIVQNKYLDVADLSTVFTHLTFPLCFLPQMKEREKSMTIRNLLGTLSKT
jgi:hypothetical protein